MPYTIKRVKLTDQNKKLLAWMDSECFPSDDPYELKRAAWWITYDEEGHPAAYAGISGVYLCRAGVMPSDRGRGLQRRLLSVRERFARKTGLTVLITDTVDHNPASVNNLIHRGFVQYLPAEPWKGKGSLYWQKELK